MVLRNLMNGTVHESFATQISNLRSCLECKWFWTVVFVVATLLLSTSTTLGDDHHLEECKQDHRLDIGQQAQVVNGLPNRLRRNPSVNAESLVDIPSESIVTVLDGPFCFQQLNWWRVHYKEFVGWTAEGDGDSTYWLEDIPPVRDSICLLETRLKIGYQGQIISEPHRIRNAIDGVVIGLIPYRAAYNFRARFDVLDGPFCGQDGLWWWYIKYDDIFGWTAEGDAGVYWIEPILLPESTDCNPTSRLVAGEYARVSGGSMTMVRHILSPIGQSALDYLATGEIVLLLDGPICDSQNGNWWWQILFRNQIGWTIETSSREYYTLEPWSGDIDTCEGMSPSPLLIGGLVRLNSTQSIPLTLRPETTSSVHEELAPGTMVEILGGPECDENSVWWKVIIGSKRGWIAEDVNLDLWIEPT